MDIPVKHMALDYFPEFKCLCDKCNYTCCQVWKVGIWRNEYMRIKNLRTTPEMRKKIDTGLRRIKNDKNNFYAQIVMNEEGVCPFLNEHDMCGLQIQHGYNILSEICKIFPRMKKASPFQWEEYCTLGCEQVVNLLLARPQGLRLIELNNQKEGVVSSDFREKVLKQDPRLEYYNECQMLFMGILQNRNYSLPHRILLAGLAARDLDKCKTKQETLGFLQKSLSLLEYDEAMEQTLNELQSDMMSGLRVALMPVLIGSAEKMSGEIKDTVFKQMMIEIYKNIEVTQTEDETGSVTFKMNPERYIAAKEHFASLEYTGYLMENIMVNTLIQQQFPLLWTDKEQSVWNEYLNLCAIYDIFKVLSTAYMADKTDSQDMVHVVTVCSRMMLHDKGFQESVVQSLKLAKKDSMIEVAQFLYC